MTLWLNLQVILWSRRLVVQCVVRIQPLSGGGGVVWTSHLLSCGFSFGAQHLMETQTLHFLDLHKMFHLLQESIVHWILLEKIWVLHPSNKFGISLDILFLSSVFLAGETHLCKTKAPRSRWHMNRCSALAIPEALQSGFNHIQSLLRSGVVC